MTLSLGAEFLLPKGRISSILHPRSHPKEGFQGKEFRQVISEKVT